MAISFTFKYTQGLSYARGTGIDPYLTEKEIADLYKRWHKNWPEKNVFSGGVEEITCEMILEVPVNELQKEFGKKAAAHFIEVARTYTGR